MLCGFFCSPCARILHNSGALRTFESRYAEWPPASRKRPDLRDSGRRLDTRSRREKEFRRRSCCDAKVQIIWSAHRTPLRNGYKSDGRARQTASGQAIRGLTGSLVPNSRLRIQIHIICGLRSSARSVARSATSPRCCSAAVTIASSIVAAMNPHGGTGSESTLFRLPRPSGYKRASGWVD
jgi:hypothetical protein